MAENIIAKQKETEPLQHIRSPNPGNCAVCNKSLLGKRPDAIYCSDKCYGKARNKTKVKERTCLQCGKIFPICNGSDANRKYCSRQCSRRSSEKKISGWKCFHPGYMKIYNRNRIVKNPGAWTEKYRQNRKKCLELLGEKCIACGVTNPNWLHIDYIPTTRGKPSRHSRQFAFIKKHKEDFRLICANHHYELTITGKIEGTDITQ